MPKRLKKLLTLQDLSKYCEDNKLYSFNSKDSGYELVVQVPGIFEANDEDNDGLLYTKLKVCHIDLNRNESYISEENMTKALPSLKYRPILAAIHTLDDGTKAFHSHDIEINEETGEPIYIEKQIGCFTADEPYLEYDKENDKTYVMANGAIPEDYTEAADIIRENNGTKVSCELVINSMSYNSKEHYLELIDFRFNGCTCLGYEKDGTEIGEGMLGSRLDIEDFSASNNGIVDFSTELVEVQEKLDKLLSRFDIDNFAKGGNQNLKFKELLEKYNVTAEDVTFDYSEMSDEELEAKFAELFEEDTTDVDGEEDTPEPTFDGEDDGTGEEDPEPIITENKRKKCSIESEDGTTVEFELSYDDISNALWNIVNETYSDSDNCYYGVKAYEDYVIMQDWCSGRTYKQTYKNEDNSIILTGDRVEVYANYLTKEEESALADMRSNYSSIQEKLDKYVKAEEKIEKEKVLSDDAYAEFLESDEFKELIKNIDTYSLEDLTLKAEVAFAKLVKARGKFEFTKKEDKKPAVQISNTTDIKDQPYGTLFSK